MIFNYKDYHINYLVDGDLNSDKEVIIILNGIMMSTASWEMFVDVLSKDNVLVRFDMIDQGESSKVDFQYTQELQVEVLDALINHLELKKPNLVGISYGSSVALQYSIKFPSKINRMVIANGVAKTSPWLKAIGDGWNEVAKSRNALAYYNITIPYIYSPQFYTKNIKWMEERKEILLPLFGDDQFLDRITRLTISAETHDTLNDLHMIKAETLIISSGEDFLTPEYEQIIIHKNIQSSELVKVPNCGHASMYEVPAQFTSLVLNHINK
ncbi:Putative aminoacrylate hydrolase RutD [Candidatus Izimaplasma bacterium HR1]|jgi:pimeloyl-ACP methyl ester carboxylesterase|uniref:alpha/beta fold hydrolase n=1 Tax=Candidatus Izimoplasma sp. HR1 TaxID=1541959 RepID=UPI0004F5ACE0|nr:Putative aminoacrylate hydrolase RutD [Candidatus Izimaplasma bacterium HR1]